METHPKLPSPQKDEYTKQELPVEQPGLPIAHCLPLHNPVKESHIEKRKSGCERTDKQELMHNWKMGVDEQDPRKLRQPIKTRALEKWENIQGYLGLRRDKCQEPRGHRSLTSSRPSHAPNAFSSEPGSVPKQEAVAAFNPRSKAAKK